MKATKKIIIAFILLFTFIICYTFKLNAVEKYYVDVSADQEFSLNSVSVLLQHDVSVSLKDYTKNSFAEVLPDRIEDNTKYPYEEIRKYLQNQPCNIEHINLETFRRDLTLYWNEDKTKEEIIEIIHILEERDDVYSVSPNYLYDLQSIDPFDIVYNYSTSDRAWCDLYRIKVLKRIDDTYKTLDLEKAFAVEIEILQSYNDIVGIGSSIDQYINNHGRSNLIYIVDENVYANLYPNYEYILRINNLVEVRNSKTHQKEINLYNVYGNEHLIRIINNRISGSNTTSVSFTKSDGTTSILAAGGGLTFSELTRYIFNIYEYINPVFKNKIDFELDFAGGYQIKYKEGYSSEDFVGIPFYIYVNADFFLPGDDVLIFDEYFKIVKEVYYNHTRLNPENAAAIRANVLAAIEQTRKASNQ